MSEGTYQRVLMGCGGFLVVFGMWFMGSQMNLF